MSENTEIQIIKKIKKARRGTLFFNESFLAMGQLLRKEKPTRLKHDFYLAPAWIREIMRPVLNETKNE